MFKLNCKNLVYLPIIFLFFPAFAICFPFWKAAYLIFFFVLYFSIALLLITKRKDLINNFISVIKNTPLKYYLAFFLFAAINSVFLSFLGISSITQSLRSIMIQIVLAILPFFLYFLFVINKMISYKRFIKIFLLLFYIDLIVGFVAFIGELFNITFINSIFDFLANARMLSFANRGVDAVASGYESFGFPRLDNLFQEPSNYAAFLYCYMPIVYSVFRLKEPLYKNKLLDKIVKYTIIPFSWISLILTASPMFLIFSIIITLFYFKDNIIKILYKNFVKFIIILFLFCLSVILLFSQIDFSQTYLSRIINVLNINSIEDLIIVEGSLATRILNYAHTFEVFQHHPLTGVGFGNVHRLMLDYYMHSNIPITSKILERIQHAIATNTIPPVDTGFLYNLLAENGLFITSIFLYFYYQLLKNMHKINKKFKIMQYEFYEKLSYGLKCSLLGFCILFFYDLYIYNNDFMLIIILSILMMYNTKILSKNRRDNEN